MPKKTCIHYNAVATSFNFKLPFVSVFVLMFKSESTIIKMCIQLKVMNSRKLRKDHVLYRKRSENDVMLIFHILI